MTDNNADLLKTEAKEDDKEGLPLWWHFLLIVSLFVGMVFVGFNWELAEGFFSISKRVKQDAWLRFIGILMIAIPISFWAIRVFMIGVEKAFYGKVTTTRRDLWPPTLVGSLEGLMYPIAFLIGQTSFVGVWLLVKVVGQWGPNFSRTPNGTEEGLEAHRKKEKGAHRSFDRFLVGNALRIIFSVLTFVAMKVFVLEVRPWH